MKSPGSPLRLICPSIVNAPSVQRSYTRTVASVQRGRCFTYGAKAPSWSSLRAGAERAPSFTILRWSLENVRVSWRLRNARRR